MTDFLAKIIGEGVINRLAAEGISKEDFQDSMNWAYGKWLKANHLEDSDENMILFSIDVLKTGGHLPCL